MGFLNPFKMPPRGEFERWMYEAKSPNEMMDKREEQRMMEQGKLQTKWEEQREASRRPQEQPAEELRPQGWWQRFLDYLFPFRH